MEARDNTGTVAGDVEEAEITEAVKEEYGNTTGSVGVEHTLDTGAVDVETDAVAEAVEGIEDVPMETGAVFPARPS